MTPKPEPFAKFCNRMAAKMPLPVPWWNRYPWKTTFKKGKSKFKLT